MLGDIGNATVAEFQALSDGSGLRVALEASKFAPRGIIRARGKGAVAQVWLTWRNGRPRRPRSGRATRTPSRCRRGRRRTPSRRAQGQLPEDAPQCGHDVSGLPLPDDPPELEAVLREGNREDGPPVGGLPDHGVQLDRALARPRLPPLEEVAVGPADQDPDVREARPLGLGGSGWVKRT